MVTVRAATLADIPSLTRVMAEAFSVKMQVLFGGDPERTQRLLISIYSGPLERGYDGILVAERDGQIVGGLVIEPMPWEPLDIHRVDTAIANELGLWRQLWNRIGFSVFSHGPADGDAYLSDVCVLKAARGLGIGHALVAASEDWARRRGCAALTLWVASNNKVAQHVYEKAGMVAVRRESNLLSALLFGIMSWTYMRKALVVNDGQTNR